MNAIQGIEVRNTNTQNNTPVRVNMSVEELIKLTGAAPVVIGKYRGCSGAKSISRVDQKTGRAYEISWVTHHIEVQADGVFDQLRVIESLDLAP